MGYGYGEPGDLGFGAFPDYRAYGAGPEDGAAGPAVPVIVQQPSLTQQLWGFIKSPLGWAFLAGAVYIANKQGYLEGVKEKAKDLLGNLGDEGEVQE